MKKLTTKLMISVLSVALAFIALGTSTFAWFSMNTTVEATGMELTAVTPINLLINDAEDVATASKWKNSIAADEDFGTGKLYPASSANGKDRFNAIVNSGNYINSGNGGAAEDTTKFQKSSDVNIQNGESHPTELPNDEDNEDNGYWATYTFALKLSEAQDNPGATVYLSTLNIYYALTVEGNSTQAGANYDKYYQWNSSTKTYDKVSLANAEAIVAAGNYFVLGGLADAARVALYKGTTKGALTDLVAIYANNNETTTKPVSSQITTYSTAYSTISAQNDAVVNAYAAGDTYTFNVNDQPVYVTLVVWIEGQDADCVNANAGQSLKIQLGFSVKQA